MLQTFFLTVNEWISGGPAIAALGCFLWGMISVAFSPCHLASIPLIVAYVGGQQQILKPRQASCYSVAFSLGLFITIALIGIICALLGRMLGDVGNYWQILVGLVLLWVALGMFGVEKCSMSGSLLYRLNLKGIFGAFALGLAYGVLSGSCTFGFIAPILAIITRPLPTHRCGRQFRRRCQRIARKQHLARRGKMVPQGSRRRYWHFGSILHCESIFCSLTSL
jgi:cytochrome c-type biogenesis protein